MHTFGKTVQVPKLVLRPYTFPYMQLLSSLTTEQNAIVLVTMALLIATLIAWIVRLERRIHRLSHGVNGKNLEEIINAVLNRYESFREYQKELNKLLANHESRIEHAARGIGVVRFDAFAGTATAGKQSFAVAILTERGDGVVISALHAREQTRTFAKPVHGFTSDHELSDEERAAIDKARTLTT